MPSDQNITAVLGPTNTGKTHYAVERMLGYESGVMGFPLRLLAREIYDKVVALRGRASVALITGEEKIVPDKPAYWICTVESMPLDKNPAFLAVDEIQMAADPQRGHVFTHRLLNARGRDETLFLGAETVRPILQRLLPDAHITRRTRFSELQYAVPVKLSRLPRRSAVVAFTADDVYAIAELIRRQRGGTAVVMGALSPRTRNAQVDLYESGEVDYLVATDAIGMGLNMDIDHVAFAATAKFDGKRRRRLTAAELGQIAGRAGRHMQNGSFSTIAGSDQAVLDPALIRRIEEHNFERIRVLRWRNSRLEFTTPGRLIRSLEEKSKWNELSRVGMASDLSALKSLAADEAIHAMARDPESVRLLWDVCQIPDFRKLSDADHILLLKRIFKELRGPENAISHDWIARQVSRLDNVQGDIDTLASRIASIRTWTYVAHRRGWLHDAAHWAHVTRAVEDKLSDALHDRLTQRFVDRRTTVLMRQLRQRGELSVSVDDGNDVFVEGHHIGRLEAFTFRPDPDADAAEIKKLESAADQVLSAEIARRAKIFCNIGYKTLSLDYSAGFANPRLIWQKRPIAHVVKGGSRYEPEVRLVRETLLSGEAATTVVSKCQEWLNSRIADKLGSLLDLNKELALAEPSEADAPLTGLARGIAFQLAESYGVLEREAVAKELRQVDQEQRRGLRRFHIRIGATSLYIPLVLKPHAVELRLMLWALWEGLENLPEMPTPGMVWTVVDVDAPAGFCRLAGFRNIGEKAVRIDMLERLADAVRPLGMNGNKFDVSPEIMGLVGLSGDDFAKIMQALGYAHEKRLVSAAERRRQRIAAEEQQSRPEPDSEEKKDDSAETAAADQSAGGTSDAAEHGATDGPGKEAKKFAAKAGARAAESSESDPAVQKPVEAEPADVKRLAAAVTDSEGSGETQNDEEPVELYRFWWAPASRKGGRRPDKRKKANGPARSGGKGQKRRSPAKAPAQKAGHKPAFQPKKRREAQIDSDSPFAKLKDLKRALEKKT